MGTQEGEMHVEGFLRNDLTMEDLWGSQVAMVN